MGDTLAADLAAGNAANNANAKVIYYGLDWPEWFWQNNDNQTDFEYAQAHRWHSQSDGAG